MAVSESATALLHGLTSRFSDAPRRATYALTAGVPGFVRVVDHATELPSGNVGLM